MAAPTLMFCVGATKAGTSWLYEELAGHPECHLRSIKELHYFDALESGRRDVEARQHGETIDTLTQRWWTAPVERRPRLEERIADRRAYREVLTADEGDVSGYLDYLQVGRGEAALVGDVTPAYALLPTERLSAMARLLPDVRFVYLLRDPVARLWSHVRMIARRRSPEPTAEPERTARILNRTLRGEEREIEIRGDYAGALGRLDAAIAPERLLVMFYEELIAPGGLPRLCRFLGISAREGDTARRVHEGEKIEMKPGQRRRARAWLQPQYEHVQKVMGRLPDAWLDVTAPSLRGATG